MAGPTAAGIIEALVAGKVKLKNWEGDHLKNDDLSDIKPTISGVGPVHLNFKFTEKGAGAKTLEGQRPLAGEGKHVVKLGGSPVPGARITFQPTIKGKQPRLIVKFIVKDKPNPLERYRFDADVDGLI